jgi:hypothetical protein
MPALTAMLRYAAAPGATATRFSKLAIAVPAGSTVRVTCRGTGCPKALRGAGWTKRRASGTVALTRLVAGAHLRHGARLTFAVTRAGSIGAVRTLTIRARKAPLMAASCLAPGAAAPRAC